MKTPAKKTMGTSALLLLTMGAPATQLEIVRAFQVGPVNPSARLVQGKDGSFYGTTAGGYYYGDYTGGGTVFRISTNAALTTLVQFTVADTNADGANPRAGLVLGRDGSLYGTTSDGGANGYGTVFRVTPEGDLTTLLSFDRAYGANPQAELVLGADGDLYGTTEWGGNGDHGTVFKVTTNGVYTTLVSFDSGTNGANPQAALALGPGGNLYGTTTQGGGSGYGTFFQVTPNGLLKTLASFQGTESPVTSRLTLGSDGNFYGTASRGYSFGNGTIFRITTNGMYTTLFEFGPAFDNGSSGYTNAAGASPGELVLGPDGSLYGTTLFGGSEGNGTVFRVTTDGVVTTLAQFGAFYFGRYANGRGDPPRPGLILGSDGSLYGMTGNGGASGDGTVFRFTTNGVLTPFFSFSGARLSGMAMGRDGNFYGIISGGSSSSGSVFTMTTNGVLTTLAEFGPLTANSSGAQTNASGAYPSMLILGSDGAFYGITSAGGASGNGTMFQITTNGLLTTVASFNATNVPPESELAVGSDGSFYGTTEWGGTSGEGTVFKLTTNGGLATVAEFNNSNGADPASRLVLGPDGSLYGTTEFNAADYFGTKLVGVYGEGTVFKVTTNGVLTTVASFDGTNGGRPVMGLVLGHDGDFYGISPEGIGPGTAFKLTSSGTLTGLGSLATNALGNGLVLGGDDNFYGCAVNIWWGESWIFQLTTNGVATRLVSTRAVGSLTSSRLVVLGSDGNPYGMSGSGGPGGGGTIFRLRLGVFLTGVTLTGVTLQPGGGELTGNGSPDQSYRLWASVDASLPLASWTLLWTGFFDGNGDFSYWDAGASTNQSRFYRLSVP